MEKWNGNKSDCHQLKNSIKWNKCAHQIFKKSEIALESLILRPSPCFTKLVFPREKNWLLLYYLFKKMWGEG